MKGLKNHMNQPQIIFNAKSTAPTLDIFGGNDRKRSGSDAITFTPIKDRISPEQYAKMAAHYEVVCVNDYGDAYHMSDEDRHRISKYHDLFTRLNRCKRKHKRLNDFVKVYRLAMECLKAVAKDNGIYRPKVFRKMVMDGKIKVTGLFFPSYIGRDRKSVGWETVAEYILDTTLDPNDLMPKEIDLSYDDDDSGFTDYFTEEDYQHVLEVIEKYDKLPAVSVDDNPPEIYAKVHSKKESKHFSDNHPEVIKAIKESQKASKKRKRIQERVNGVYLYEMSESEFNEISEIDERRGYSSYDDDMPVFRGNIMKRKDYKRYMHALDMYEEEHCIVNVDGKMKTVEEANMDKLMREFASSGINVRALYKNKADKKKLKKIHKQDEKRIKKLKSQILEIKKRDKKLVDKHGIEFNAKDEKKLKKGKKKKKSKNKDKEKRQQTEVQRITEEAMDNVLLDTLVGEEDYENFKEWQEDMEDFTFDNVFGK